MHTLHRRPYVPAETILSELEQWLATNDYRPDYITLGGLGEPCLNSDLGRIITGIKDLAPEVPIAVLTNSSLLGDPLIRKELLRCQAVLPSLDTLVEQECSVLNAPCFPLDPEELAHGILHFAREFSGRLFLEILLVQGYNDTEENLGRLRSFCRELRPHRIDVVTMTRPGACLEARPIAEETLHRWRSELEPLAKGTGPEPGHRKAPSRMRPEAKEEVLASLRRRPQTRSDLMAGLGIEGPLVDEIVGELLREGLIAELDLGQTTYFKPVGSG